MEDIQTFDSFKITSGIIGEYNIYFIKNLLLSFNQNINNKKLIYLIDDSLTDLYPREIKLISENHKLIFIDAIENNKTLNYVDRLVEKLIEAGVKKDSTLIAVGGGITQDIVAFISSVLFRGVDWEFFPTTLFHSGSGLPAQELMNLCLQAMTVQARVFRLILQTIIFVSINQVEETSL